MPKGISPTIQAELNKTTLPDIVYALRVHLVAGIQRWSNRRLEGVELIGDPAPQIYTPRLADISGLDHDPAQSAPVTITLANWDDAITNLDLTESFAGAPCEFIEFIPSLNESLIKWSGSLDELSEISPEFATLTAYPESATTRFGVPRRAIALPCPHDFGNFINWQSQLRFDGAGCPYGRGGHIGFRPVLSGFSPAIDATTDPATFTVRWPEVAVANGAAFRRGHRLRIDNELLLIIEQPNLPDASFEQTIQASRGEMNTPLAAHEPGTDVLRANCTYTTQDCIRAGMYGNNPDDNYDSGAGIKRRNYFGGFPFLSGSEYGRWRTPQDGRRSYGITFSGNESAYGMTLPVIIGRARVSPILLIAKGEDDFMASLWAISEGLLATNPDNDDQSVRTAAYIFDAASNGPSFFVNGVSRHDPRPGYGFENYNGQQDQPNPTVAFGTGIPDFANNHLGFAATAWAVVRINTKNNPAVDVRGQSITAAADIQYGQIVRVYADADDYEEKPTTNPVWGLMLLMTSKRFGGGRDHARLNIASFVQAASYCNEAVTDTFTGGLVPRYTFNGIVDPKQAYSEWLHILCSSMSCLRPFPDKDGKLKLKVLKAENLTGIPVFDEAATSVAGRNVIWENDRSSLVFRRRLSTEIPNEVHVEFVSLEPGFEYVKVRAIIADRDAQREAGLKRGDQSMEPLVKVVRLPGVTTLDEAARIGTLILRAGEFAEGGRSNNRIATWKAAYRDTADLEPGDIVELRSRRLSSGAAYFRVLRMHDEPIRTDDGGLLFGRVIEASIHDNAMFDDTAFTVTKFERVDPPPPFDAEPPAVTAFSVLEAGAFDANNKPVSALTFLYTEPDPLLNYRSCVIYKSEDGGLKWDRVIELFNPGTTIHVPVTGVVTIFAALSKALTGFIPDIETRGADGNYKYPRFTLLVDGVTDVLPAPGNFQIFVGATTVTLRWDKYAPEFQPLFKEFRIYRSPSSTRPLEPLDTLDGTLFIDGSVAPDTTYYYWVTGYSILLSEGPAAGPLTSTSPSGAGADTGIPAAPLIGVVRNIGSFNTNEYEFLVGIDRPGGAANWAGIVETELEITTNADFLEFPLGRSLQQSYSLRPPFTEGFRTNFPGTYYFRARVKNSFGFSAWSATLGRATNFDDNLSEDTAIMAAVTPGVLKQGDPGGDHLAGNEFEISFTIPTANSSSYWGYSPIIHDSPTLPVSTKYVDGFASGYTLAMAAGSQTLTVTPSPGWTADELAGKDLLIFHPSRAVSPSWDLEGLFWSGRIVSNSANTIAIDTPAQLMKRSASGYGFHVIDSGAGHHFEEKVKYYPPPIVNEGILTTADERGSRKRRIKFVSGIPTIYIWMALWNLHGQGKVHATTVTETFDGITGGEIGAGAIEGGNIAAGAVDTLHIALAAITEDLLEVGAVTETKIGPDAVTTPKIVAGAVIASKISVANLGAINANMGTITAGTITGATIQTAASGARVVMDSTNGLRAFNASGQLRFQVPVSGTRPGSPSVPKGQGMLASDESSSIAFGDNFEIYTDGQLRAAFGDTITHITLSGTRYSLFIDGSGFIKGNAV